MRPIIDLCKNCNEDVSVYHINNNGYSVVLCKNEFYLK